MSLFHVANCIIQDNNIQQLHIWDLKLHSGLSQCKHQLFIELSYVNHY